MVELIQIYTIKRRQKMYKMFNLITTYFMKYLLIHKKKLGNSGQSYEQIIQSCLDAISHHFFDALF